MNKFLEVYFTGWTATPRMPFILSGNAICLPVPTYSILLGIIGCCLGRVVEAHEVSIGYQYSFDTIGTDLETRQRLEFDGKKLKSHSKGSDAYAREFHVMPKLKIWIDRLDWEVYFKNPIGTPSLGRSQDILKIEYTKQIDAQPVQTTKVFGCMLPFTPKLQLGGQLIQLAEAFSENEEIGGGRKPTKTSIFMAIPFDSVQFLTMPNLFQTIEKEPVGFYLHQFSS